LPITQSIADFGHVGELFEFVDVVNQPGQFSLG
jgi:hypothetical protein